MKFEGIYPPVITPYHDDCSIDEDGFAVVLERLIKAGVHGIVVGGTTGEYYAQTFEERVRLMELAAQTIAGRVPMIAGVGSIRTEECIAYAEAAHEHGAKAILLNAPSYVLPTQHELAEYALDVVRAVNLPVMLYNYPARTGTMMQADFFKRISHRKNFAAVKDASADPAQLRMLACDYPNITLLCGVDDQALEFFAWGARGWVCAGGNFLPKEHMALYQAVAVENDIAKGREIMAALLPLMSVLEQGGKFVQAIKYACTLSGLPAGPARSPLRVLNKKEKRNIEQVLKTVKKTFAKLNS